jgi:hypothetical protein
LVRYSRSTDRSLNLFSIPFDIIEAVNISCELTTLMMPLSSVFKRFSVNFGLLTRLHVVSLHQVDDRSIERDDRSRARRARLSLFSRTVRESRQETRSNSPKSRVNGENLAASRWQKSRLRHDYAVDYRGSTASGGFFCNFTLQRPEERRGRERVSLCVLGREVEKHSWPCV